MPTTTPLSYTLQQAAAATGLSSKTLSRAIEAGALLAVKPTEVHGKRARTLVLHTDLMAWLTGDRARETP